MGDYTSVVYVTVSTDADIIIDLLSDCVCVCGCV